MEEEIITEWEGLENALEAEIISNGYGSTENDKKTNLAPIKLVSDGKEVGRRGVSINNGTIIIGKKDFKSAAVKEAQIRELELARWAEEQGLVLGYPKAEDLDKVFKKLSKGVRIVDAIDGICSYAAWCRLRKTFPWIADMEEGARAKRRAYLEKKMEERAEALDRDERSRDKMGAIARDRLINDSYAQQIAAIDKEDDRLTAIRLKDSKQASAVVPIQINVEYVGESNEKK